MSPNCVRWAAVDDKVDVVAVFASAYENDDLIYPLVNVYIAMERSTILLLGKSTISTGPFSSSQTVNVYQAG